MESGVHSGEKVEIGRFAPSPSGRMHLGNLFTALLSWLDVKSRAGRWVLRIEDLDPQRCKPEYARLIEEDLLWLGLEWDEGGIEGRGSAGPYLQSRRHEIYGRAIDRLKATGLCYPCKCTRAEINATQAPHASDGRIIYPGTCRPAPGLHPVWPDTPHSVRIAVPSEPVCFVDETFGPQSVNLAADCGDFVLRRADGAFAYQLAVVVDDHAMGVNRVVRGCDLLESTAQQIFLCRLLGYEPPAYRHVPLITNSAGVRLGKRDSSLAMDSLRLDHTPESLLGLLACKAGLIPAEEPVSLTQLLDIYKQNVRT